MMVKKWILVCKGLVDNSSAVEGFGQEAKAIYDQKSKKNYWIM
jgi:hypothetical protein